MPFLPYLPAPTDDPTKQNWHHEYYHLQQIVTGYNADCLSIKNWSVTVAAAAIGYAYVQHEKNLLLVSAAGAITFLFTEAYWRANQLAFINRIRDLEEPAKKRSDSPRISREWLNKWNEIEIAPGVQDAEGGESLCKSVKHIWKAAWTVRAWLPHAFIMVAALLLYRYAPPDPKKDHRCSATITCDQPVELERPDSNISPQPAMSKAAEPGGGKSP